MKCIVDSFYSVFFFNLEKFSKVSLSRILDVYGNFKFLQSLQLRDMNGVRIL